jgi:uncharacterized protein
MDATKRPAREHGDTIVAMSAPAFHDLLQALDTEESLVHPAEAHGCLCGALCVSAAYSIEEWLDEMLGDSEPLPQGEDLQPEFVEIFQHTSAVLSGDQMEFQPLLPEDSASLVERTEALAQWCQGFLYGFGTSGRVRGRTLPEEVDEVLADFAQIARAAEAEETGEDQEAAYVEVVEFLRAATQLVYDQLAPLRSVQFKTSHTH